MTEIAREKQRWVFSVYQYCHKETVMRAGEILAMLTNHRRCGLKTQAETWKADGHDKMQGGISMTCKFRIIIILVSMLLTMSASAATFKGRVIDADTKQPIEGAVVVASWSEERATPAGPTQRSKDMKETLTDKDGTWVIKGPKGGEVGNIKAILSFVTGIYFTTPPEFIIFKPGYCSWPGGFAIEICKQGLKPEGSDKVAAGVTVELPKLTDRHRETLSRNIPFIAAEKDGKTPIFDRLLDQDILGERR